MEEEETRTRKQKNNANFGKRESAIGPTRARVWKFTRTLEKKTMTQFQSGQFKYKLALIARFEIVLLISVVV